MDFVKVPAGPFTYGPEESYERLDKSRALRPRQQMDLPEFYMAKYPVTVGEWRTFLDETGRPWEGRWWTLRRRVRGAWRKFGPTNKYPALLADFPIVDVSQADAYAFCVWLSNKLNRRCTLPSEEMWEKAARGTDGRTYPWGEQHPRPDVRWQRKFPVGFETYLFSLIVRPWREWARSGWYWRTGTPLPVGSIAKNVSPYGAFDMAGNVWEWTSSLYNPDIPDFHVVKGGSWGYSVHHTKLYVRSACSITVPSDHYHAQGTGFRVAIVEK